MKKLLVVGLVIASLSLLFGFAIPVLAHGSGDGETAPADQEAWEAMHEACENGDWEAMAEAAEEVHGEDFGDMPCHDEGDYSSNDGWGGMGRGMMGGSMMSGGWGGMM